MRIIKALNPSRLNALHNYTKPIPSQSSVTLQGQLHLKILIIYDIAVSPSPHALSLEILSPTVKFTPT